MDINYEVVKNLENNVLDKIIFRILEPENIAYFNEAKSTFNKLFPSDNYSYTEKGFLLWLVWDYNYNNNNLITDFLIKEKGNLNHDEIEMIDSLRNGIFSVYRLLRKNSNTLIIKDIFSEIEYVVADTIGFTEPERDNLLIGRIYKFSKKYYICEDHIVVDKSFRSFIEKNVYEKYESSNHNFNLKNINEYVQKNSLIIFKLGTIVDQIIEEQNDNQDYRVWQSIYLFKDIREIKEELFASNLILQEDEEDSLCFKLYNINKDRILAEIILEQNRIEVESNSQKEINQSKEIIENLLGDKIKHLKDEILSINDLL